MTKKLGKNILVQIDEDSGELFLDLKQALDGTNVNPEDVSHYDLEAEEGNMSIRLYDKDKNIIKVGPKK